MKKIIINACSDLGVHVDGAALGPVKLTENIKNENIINIKYPKIKKSLSKDDLEKNLKEVNEFNENLYKEILRHNEFTITIGGDHSISIASTLASVKKNKTSGIIWIDAHPDYNTFETTITGNLHGLPLASINGLCDKLSFFHDDNYIKPSNTVIVGARAIDALEQVNLDKNKIKVFSTKDVQNNNVTDIMEEAFKIAGDKKIHISFDIDVIDPILAPGVSVPEINGISLEKASEIFDYILLNLEKISSIDIVEYNPIKDKDNKTLKFVDTLLKKLINSLD